MSGPTYNLLDASGTKQFGLRYENEDLFWHDHVNNVDVMQYDRSEGAWIPADGGASLGTSANPWSSLTTEEAAITDGLVAGELLGTASGSDEAQITGIDLPSWKQVIIRISNEDQFRLEPDNATATLNLTMNDDNNGESYGYVSNDGTAVRDEDVFRIVEVDDQVNLNGTVILNTTTGGVGIVPQISGPWRAFNRVTELTVMGGWASSATGDDSIELFATDGDGRTLEIEAYGVV